MFSTISGLSKEITHVSSARLLTLLSQSFLWQQEQGLQLETGFDLFKGTAPIQQTEDTMAVTPYVSIKVSNKSKKIYKKNAVFSWLTSRIVMIFFSKKKVSRQKDIFRMRGVPSAWPIPGDRHRRWVHRAVELFHGQVAQGLQVSSRGMFVNSLIL